MIVAPKADAGEVLGLVVANGAPVAADGPDFAAMMVSLGTVEPVASANPAPQIEPAERIEILSTASIVTADAVPQGREQREAVCGDAALSISQSPRTASTRGLVAEDERETVDQENDVGATAENSPRENSALNAVIMTIVPMTPPETVISEIAPLRDKFSPKRVGEPGGDANAARVSADRPDLWAAIRRVAPLDIIGSRPAQELDSRAPMIPLVLEMRTLISTPLSNIDKLVSPMPDRAPTFPTYIADAARDVLRMTGNADMRFNVRPETLGAVAVTIERGDAGLGLRLGVETPSAVQAVRQAESMLNDVRGHAPFVQISVDLNSSDTRGRPARAAALIRRTREDDREIMSQPAPVTTGRYA